MATGKDVTGDDGKGRPTPKRKDAESQRKQGLSVPKDPKAARKAARSRDRVARTEARAGLMAGDVRFFPVRDRGPVKEYVRDTIDSRRTVGEVFVPAAFLVLIGGLIPGKTIQRIVLYGWSAMLLFVILDTFIVGVMLNSSLKNIFPEKSERRGAVSYGVLRAMQMRRFRIPPARVGPGGKPVTRKPRG